LVPEEQQVVQLAEQAEHHLLGLIVPLVSPAITTELILFS